MKLPDWSLVQYRADGSEKVAVGVSSDGVVVHGPPETGGLSRIEVLERWDTLAPLLRDWTHRRRTSSPKPDSLPR